MSDKNQPAFPVQDASTWQAHGLSIRDYFAAKAMQGILSDSNAVDEETGNKITIPDDAESVAVASYEMADAMIRAREAK